MTLYNPFTKVFIHRPIYRGSDWKVTFGLMQGETAVDLTDYTVRMVLGRNAEISKEYAPSENSFTLALSASEQEDLPNPRKNCELYPIEVYLVSDTEKVLLIRDSITVYRQLEASE